MASSSPSSSSSSLVKAPSFINSMQSLTANILSRLPFSPLNSNHNSPKPSPPAPATATATATCPPLCISLPPPCSSSMTVPLLFSLPSSSQNQSHERAPPSPPSATRSLSSSVRVDGLSSSAKEGGGPAFVGQVFSMLDPSGNGLMAVTTHFDIPFLSKRAPEWMKKMFATVTRSEQNGPVFRFFMDLSDAVQYVKRLKIPTGMVGACRLDVAYEHFKEKPHMFQFVPNERQVKAANRLLKKISRKGGKRKVDGVPVFTAQNLNIAIATNEGIKWYTPYFFDKNLLDSILETSVDQHFHTLIQNRHMQRRRDIIDDSLTADVVEESVESLFEPPEVQEVMDELGHSGIPLNVISKVAEIQLLDVVDKVLLGNKWLRKATGIQPEFPYLVDSFEERSAASFPKAAALASSSANSEGAGQRPGGLYENAQSRGPSTSHAEFQFPFGDWFSNPWSRLHGKQHKADKQIEPDKRISGSNGDQTNQIQPNPLLPKITMVGISMGEGSQMNKASLKKTMENLTKDLEQASQKLANSSEDIDPLFVANVGDYSSITRMNSS